jgi:hypothetical protein
MLIAAVIVASSAGRGDSMPMALLILGALLVPPALAYLGVIGGFVALAAEFVIVFVAAWGIDRGRRLGARDPFLDAAHPDLPVPMGAPIRPNPTEAFESPSDRRSPS